MELQRSKQYKNCKYADTIQKLEANEFKSACPALTLGSSPENLGALNKKQDERFHEDLKDMEQEHNWKEMWQERTSRIYVYY